MNVLINRKPVEGPWGGGNLFVKAFYEYMERLGHRVVQSLSDLPEIVFVQDPRAAIDQINMPEIIKYKESNPRTKIIHRVNECDARKGTDDVDGYLRYCSQFTDHTIFVSNWMKDYHISRGWACPTHSVLYNGVDMNHFFPNPKKIDNEKINIVTHHWSDNPRKGADVYSFIDNFVSRNDKFTFTYIGRTKQKLRHSTIIPPLSGKTLGAELSRYDVYVTGTRFDPGPNHIIESLACKLPTFAFTEGGGACEFVGDKHVFCDENSLVSCLQNYKQIGNNITSLPISWEECITQLNKVITGVLA